jgi:hypothetical protein
MSCYRGVVTAILTCAAASALYLLTLPSHLHPRGVEATPLVSATRLRSGMKVTLWHAQRFASPQDFPWVHPYGSTMVVILNRTGKIDRPEWARRLRAPRLILQSAVAIPPEQWGEPFRFQAMLTHELPTGTLLVNPDLDVVEGSVDSHLRLSTPGSANTRSLRRITMEVR